MLNGMPKKETELGTIKLVSKEIKKLGDKWNYSRQSREVLQDSCQPDKSKWYKDLETVHSTLIAILCMLTAPMIVSFYTIYSKYNFAYASALRGFLDEEACLITKPLWLSPDLANSCPLIRPTANCQSICQGLTEIPALEKISREEFLAKYTYSGRPLLIHNATNGWKASKSFGLSFSKQTLQFHAEKLADISSYSASDMGAKLSPEDQKLLEQCQFFPYRTKFENLAEFLNISQTRSLANDYYVGWSNCFREVVDKLREYYSWPDFLPADSEASRINWIFMGSSNGTSGGRQRIGVCFIGIIQKVVVSQNNFKIHQ